MESCLYEGAVAHRRIEPVGHEFTVGMYMLYLDLAELPELFDPYWFWSARRPAPHWFRRADYMDPDTPSLSEAVRNRVEATLGWRPTGPIRLLTHLRTLGYAFNPVSFYYVFDADSGRLACVVAEITNTPWKERHAYVIPWDENHDHRFAKEFHVSPFMSMDHEYRWRMHEPGSQLRVHMENHREGKMGFSADLQLRRTEITQRSLARVSVRYPAMTLQVILGIHAQALRLWRKKVPFHSHPSKLQEQEDPS